MGDSCEALASDHGCWCHLMENQVLQEKETGLAKPVPDKTALPEETERSPLPEEAERNLSPYQNPKDFLQRCGQALPDILYPHSSSCTMSDRKALQRIVRGAERVIGVVLPSVQELFESRCRSRTLNIVRDLSHHKLFELLPSGKRFRMSAFKIKDPRATR